MSEKIVVTIDADLQEIIPTFLENRRKDIEAIKSALETNDLASIETIAHKLAGNAGSYGLDDLGEIGAKMESACQSGDSGETKDLFNSYCTYLENLEINYED